MQAIHGPLESLAHLDLVDEDEVRRACVVALVDVGVQRVTLEQILELVEVEVDVDDVGVLDVGGHVIAEGFEQLRLAASAHAGDDLDVRGAHDVYECLQVIGPVYNLHRNHLAAYYDIYS